MLLCPKCGKSYAEPSAVSRSDNKTPIYSSCGLREALDPLAGIVTAEDVEKIVNQNKEMYQSYSHACV